MISTAAKTFRVGIVAAVALAAAALGVFLVGDEQKIWEGRTEYRIRFARTDGLAESAPVTLHGVNVGVVAKATLPDDPSASYVELTLKISDADADRIRQDTTGRLQTFGLLGDKYLQLLGGSEDSPQLEPGGLIRSTEPVDYEELLGAGGDIADNVIHVTTELKDLLSDVNEGRGLIGKLMRDEEFGATATGRIERLIASLDSASTRIDGMLAGTERGEGALGVLLADDESMRAILANLRATSADAAAFAADLRDSKELLARLGEDERRVAHALDELERASKNVAEITAHVRSGQGTLGKLVYDDALYDRLDQFLGGSSAGFWRMLLAPLRFWNSDSSPETPGANPEAGAGAAGG